jgi:CP family cyanate transporter-like MFS transporter
MNETAESGARAPDRAARTDRATLAPGAFKVIDEFVLTTVLLFLAVTVVRWLRDPHSALYIADLRIALAVIGAISGAILTGLILSPPGRRSGGHVNPAVSVGLWLMGAFPGRHVLPYVLAQLAGSAVGTGLARLAWGRAVALPSVAHAAIRPAPAWQPVSVFLAEVGGMFALTLVVAFFVACPRFIRGLPHVIGVSVGLVIALLGPLSGGSVNPARQLGPAVFSGQTTDLTIYLVAPVLGAVLGAGVYRLPVRRRRTHVPETAVAARPDTRRLRLLAGVALFLAAFSLRPAIASLGPLLEEVRASLGMSGTVAGLLTSLPALSFAVFGTAAPRLSRRYGPEAVICAGMALVTAGLFLRPFTGHTAPFLAASALALSGIAVGNVLMPVVVKRWFPHRVGTMTGLYAMSLSSGTALAAAVSVPVTDALGGGWRIGLAVWGPVAALAVLPWLPLVRGRSGNTGTAAEGTAETPAAPAGRMTGSPTAWALTVYFGLQSTGAYIAMGWLPQILRDAGVSASAAGLMLGISMAAGVPMSFVLPAIGGRLRSQAPLVIVLGLFGVAGYAGLWAAPGAAPWVWILLIGVSNCAFSLALTMIGMRSRTGPGVVRLSAFVQSAGYLLSIPGPILVGALYQHTGGWDLPVAFMLALLLPQVAAGVLAGRDRAVEDEL